MPTKVFPKRIDKTIKYTYFNNEYIEQQRNPREKSFVRHLYLMATEQYIKQTAYYKCLLKRLVMYYCLIKNSIGYKKPVKDK